MIKALTGWKKYIGTLHLRANFANLLQSLTKDESPIPYSATFEVPSGFSFSNTFLVSDFRGLLFCNIVRANPDERLISYWIDEDHFKIFSGKFQFHLGLTSPVFQGPAVEVKRKERPWWKPREHFSSREWILAVFASIGALLGLRDYAAVLFAAPDVILSYSDAGHTNAVVGEEFTVPIAVSSEVRFAPATVVFRSASIQPHLGGTSAPLTFDFSVLPNLPAGQFQTVKVSGFAPQQSTTHVTPDVYDLTLTADAKAGILRWKHQLHAPKRELWVWPASSAGPPPSVATAAATACELQGIIYVPKAYPQGLLATFILNAPRRDVIRMFVTASSNSDAKSLRTDKGPDSTLKTEFRTPPLDKFQQYRYKVTIYLTKLVEKKDCEILSSNLKPSLE